MLAATQRRTLARTNPLMCSPYECLIQGWKYAHKRPGSCWLHYWLSVCHPWPAVATHVPVQCLRAISADSKETGNMIADHWEAGSLHLKGLRDFFKWFSALTSCWVKLMCTRGAVIYFSLFHGLRWRDESLYGCACSNVCVCVCAVNCNDVGISSRGTSCDIISLLHQCQLIAWINKSETIEIQKVYVV